MLASLREACCYVGENNTEQFGQNLSDKIKNEDDPEETEEVRDSRLQKHCVYYRI